MAVRSTPVSGHLTGTGSQEIRRMQLWQLTGTPSGPTAGLFWQNSNAGNKRLYFYDDEAAAAVAVPRLDRNETVTGQWSISPGATQAPFVLGTNAQGQKVIGLNADQLDGRDSSANPTANTIALRDSNGRLAAEDPAGLTDLVNLQYLNDALEFVQLSASQITSGLLPLARGGTNADLSGAATGGLIYKAASALAATGALTGVLIGNGTSAPTALAQLDVGRGGTGGATAAAARTNLGVLWAEESYTAALGRVGAAGVTVDGASSFRIQGTSEVAFGSSDFTIHAVIRLRDYTPGSELIIWAQSTTINSSVRSARLNLTTNGNFRLIIGKGDGTGDHSYDFAPDTPLVDGQVYAVTLTVKRDGNATLYINGVTDRDYNGSPVVVAVASSSAVNIGTSGTAWGAGFAMNGEYLALAVFNYALPAAEVLELAQRGQSVPFQYQWGSWTNQYTSNFAAGTQNWTTDSNGTNRQVTGNVDSIGGEDDWLKIEALLNSQHIYAYNTTSGQGLLAYGKKYRVTLKVFVPSGSTVTHICIQQTGAILNQPASGRSIHAVTANSVMTITGEITANMLTGLVIAAANANGPNQHAAGTIFYIKEVVIRQIGAVLDVDFQNANPAVSTTIRDRSTFNNHATVNASNGSTSSPIRQLNVADAIHLGGLTSNAVLFNSGSGGGIVGLAQNNTATPMFLYQVSSGAPQWRNLYGESISWTGTHAFGGAITVQAPVSANHPATKQYVDDAVSAGFRLLAGGPARLKTTGNITLSGLQTIDGVAGNADDSILVGSQTAAAENGVYLMKAGAWIRRTDADTAAEITKGAYIFVQQGSVNAGSSWVQGATVTTLGTDAITFTQFFQQTAYTNGTGISISGLTISVNLGATLAWTGAHTFTSSSGLGLSPHGASAGNTTALRFYELAANGSNFVGFKAPDSVAADVVWVLPATDGSANQVLKTNGSGTLSFAQVASTEINNSSFVTAVSGTANRVTISGTLTPTVDIAADYAGQSSITTLGTISTGTWNATAISVVKGGTGLTSYTAGDLLYASNSTTLAKLALGGTPNAFLIVGASVPAWSSYALPASVGANQLLYGSSGSAVAALAAVANRILTTDNAGVLAWRNTLPSGLSVENDTDAKIVKLKWFNVGNGIDQTVTLTHNFNTRDVWVQVFENGSDYRQYDLVPVVRNSVNAVQLEFTEAPSAGQFRACVMAAI